MENKYGQYEITFDQIGFVVNTINQCTKSYNYVINLVTGEYEISPIMVERYDFPSSKGTDYFEHVKNTVHPQDIQELAQDIDELRSGTKKVHDMRYRLINRHGDTIWINCRGRIIDDEKGVPTLLVGRIAELGNKAEADDATGLLNDNRLKDQLREMAANGNKPRGSVIYIGVDDLRSVNELYGHDYGDLVIKNVAEAVLRAIVDKGMVYRTRGDGFIVYLPGIEDDLEVIGIYKQIRRNLDIIIERDSFQTLYTISAGLVLRVDTCKDYEQMFQYSEFALREAKNLGRNTFYLFKQGDYDTFISKSVLRKAMHRDINNSFKGFEVFYQPIVDAKAKTVCGAEALVRYKNDAGEYISPSEFIPILEESGHIVPLGRWVLEQAIKECGRWNKINPNFHVNVNLSYVQLEKSNIAELIGILLYKACVPADNLTIEITESGYVETGNHFNKFQNKAKSIGCHIAIDDFGSGYSNLRYLNEIQANTVKIDRSFTVKAFESEYHYNLIRTIVEMAHSLGVKVCLEGIESIEELNKLGAIEPDYYQGFLFGKPCNKKDFEKRYIAITDDSK